MITEYNDYCIICGKPRTDMHHTLGGNSKRTLSTEFGLLIPLCKEHHLGDMSVHKNKEMKILTNIIGQLAFEKEQVEKGMKSDQARNEFRRVFGKSYL